MNKISGRRQNLLAPNLYCQCHSKVKGKSKKMVNRATRRYLNRSLGA